MIHLFKTPLLAFVTLMVLLTFSASAQKKDKKHKKKHKDKQEETTKSDNTPTNNIDNNASNNCDDTLWHYVYNPARLKIIEKCKTVTGIIEESSADEDGDQHMLLKLDNGQEKLLTKRNIKKKQGDLVIEAVCANKTNLKKVGNTCNGYINKIQIPKLGAHVKVTGSLVIDTHNGWSEIHPITKIDVIN